MILSIDPGIRGCGCALFNDGGVLDAADYVEASNEGSDRAGAAATMGLAVERWVAGLYPFRDKFGYLTAVSKLVLEWPQTYGGRAGKGDANDLLPLAAVDGAIASEFFGVEVICVSPHEWKGSVQKPERAADTYAIEERVRSRLSPEEAARVEWPGSAKHRWDVADSIAIGLYHLGRFDKKRVYPRE